MFNDRIIFFITPIYKERYTDTTDKNVNKHIINKCMPNFLCSINYISLLRYVYCRDKNKNISFALNCEI